ncbi:spermidine/putrescine ABC transporter substrate-binding protein [Pseudanabaena sp. FACHB-2040]|uniref:ABC transporter substrate-binding protein n=1 Tax=Pseudanabaena sp. FACHB-2040 TaxID=2692859 RepID=UPI00168578DE|nr:spermidine/putrescine ABC transporter substrate-binding protein [Pseudanabaena sp. FACHB-2040]MBD2258514.1 spermidine/putrescine ABC transporter substrate-binding protein [Pseudanabaena sp. FACHB-2040]
MRSRQFGRNVRSHLFSPSRRRFLHFSAAAISTVALANCQRQQAGAPEAEADSQASSAGTDEPLYIYTWADYSDEEVYQRFTERTGIQVVADVYDSNETMLAKMQAGGGKQYSVLYPSDYMVQQMLELNLLSEVDKSQLTGLDNLRDRWQSPPYDPDNQHSIPVSWGTTGLIYDTTVINPGPTDLDYLWDNQSRLSGRITLLEDVRETMGAVLKSLGYSYNATDPQQIEAAYNRLRELKPAIAAFQSFGWEDRLVAGDLLMSMTYSIVGNALPVDNPNLRYIIPEGGSSVWTDTMVIPQGAPNPTAAYAWINFMMEPENAAFAVEKLRFATPNESAFSLLSNEVKESETLFPSDDVLAKCESIAPLDEATTELYDKYWTELASI